MLLLKNMQGEEFSLEATVHPAEMTQLLIGHFGGQIKSLIKQLGVIEVELSYYYKNYLRSIKNLLDNEVPLSYN